MNIFNRFIVDKYDTSYVTDNVLYLDNKIDFFYRWVSKYASSYGVDAIKDLVEKMVAWYTFRYSNNYFDMEDVDSFLLGGINKTCNKLEWCDFFDYTKFLYVLSNHQSKLLMNPKFPNMIDLYPGSRSHFHVNDDGIINDADDVWIRRKKTGPGYVMSCGIFFNGKSLRDVAQINIEENLGLNIENIQQIISNIEFKESIRNGILDTVMYRIIESGGKYYGPRRAYLFAKEFGRDISLPIMYGDSSLINEYLENGGNRELVCYIKYFDDDKDVWMYALDIANSQNLIGDRNKVMRKVFTNNNGK